MLTPAPIPRPQPGRHITMPISSWSLIPFEHCIVDILNARAGTLVELPGIFLGFSTGLGGNKQEGVSSTPHKHSRGHVNYGITPLEFYSSPSEVCAGETATNLSVPTASLNYKHHLTVHVQQLTLPQVLARSVWLQPSHMPPEQIWPHVLSTASDNTQNLST